MMAAASTSVTPVNFHLTTRRNNPGDNHLHTRRHENLKSHLEVGAVSPRYDTRTGSGAHKASNPVIIKGYFLGGKAGEKLWWPITSIYRWGLECVEIYLHAFYTHQWCGNLVLSEPVGGWRRSIICIHPFILPAWRTDTRIILIYCFISDLGFVILI
jgi:hypothetical protein